MPLTHLIIGTSAAGLSAAINIRSLDPRAQIICISDEAEFPYNKCLLASYIAGSIARDRVFTMREDSLKRQSIELKLATVVTNINVQRQCITLSSGESISCDRLLLATGASLCVQPTMLNAQGVVPWYSLASAQHIAALLSTRAIKQAVIVGAGVNGLESADALRERGVQVTIIEQRSTIMPMMLAPEVGQQLLRTLQRLNVQFLFDDEICRIKTDENNYVNCVVTKQAKELATQLVVMATGVRPRVELAVHAGIETSSEGIPVDAYQTTSTPAIFAAGDVSAAYDQLSKQRVRSALWPEALVQGRIAGAAMVGDRTQPYGGIKRIVRTELGGRAITFAGRLCDPGELVTIPHGSGSQTFLIENNRLNGFLLVENQDKVAQLQDFILHDTFFDPTLVK